MLRGIVLSALVILMTYNASTQDRSYGRSVVIAWFAYFLPTSDMHSFDGARPKIHSFERFFNTVFFGQFRQPDSRKEARQSIMTFPGASLG